MAAHARQPDPLPAAAPARLEALFLPRSRGRVHRQRQGQRPLRVWRQGLDRHHQCPRPGRPVRAARQGAAGKPLRWPHARRRHRSHRKAHRPRDRKSTRLNSSHGYISYAVFCLKKKKKHKKPSLIIKKKKKKTQKKKKTNIE